MTGSLTVVVNEVLAAHPDDPSFARIDVRMPVNIEAVIALQALTAKHQPKTKVPSTCLRGRNAEAAPAFPRNGLVCPAFGMEWTSDQSGGFPCESGLAIIAVRHPGSFCSPLDGRAPLS